MDLASNLPLLEIQGVEKAFSRVRVLRGVSLTVAPGQTVALIGENGAGKSTLMNILGGNVPPDAGCMRWSGEPYIPKTPGDATRAGIAFVHQELNLFANLTVAENLYLRDFPKRHFPVPWIDRKAMQTQAAGLLAQVGLTVSPDALVESLSPGERQLLEIAKALSIDARLIILDEPTTSLSAREAEHLFQLLQFLRARGVAMIYISHNLQEVLRLSDRVVVLRDGEVVGAGPTTDFNFDQMVTLMVGRSLRQMFPARSVTPEHKATLQAIRLTQPGVVKNITFHLRAREVLGIAGLMGSGRSELARILFGLDPCASGEVLVDGRPVRGRGPRARIRQGFAFLTEDRRGEGLALEASIADNLVLVALPNMTVRPFGLIRWGPARVAMSQLRQAVQLTASAADSQPVKTLSGGNQQKVVLAKWLLAKPRIFILDEPTRGIDVGAKVEIYRLINGLAENGSSVIVISSELDELIGLCDRILVMNRGEMKAEFLRNDFDRERILRAALHRAPEGGTGSGGAEE